MRITKNLKDFVVFCKFFQNLYIDNLSEYNFFANSEQVSDFPFRKKIADFNKINFNKDFSSSMRT